MPKQVCSILITLLMCLFANFSIGADNNSDSAPISSPHVLYHFLRGAASLSRKADAADDGGGTGDTIRKAFSSTIGFNDKDAKAIFGFAIAIDAQFASLDKRARSIIEAAESRASNGEQVPPPPPELIALQEQKTALINRLWSLLMFNCSLDGQKAIIKYLNSSNTRELSEATAQHP